MNYSCEMLAGFCNIWLLRNKIQFDIFINILKILRREGSSFFFYNEYLIVKFNLKFEIRLKSSHINKVF